VGCIVSKFLKKYIAETSTENKEEDFKVSGGIGVGMAGCCLWTAYNKQKTINKKNNNKQQTKKNR